MTRRSPGTFVRAFVAPMIVGALLGACSNCSGTPFEVQDGSERVQIPGAGTGVTLWIPEITVSGASAQRAIEMVVSDEGRELAHPREVYEGQSFTFVARGARFRIEVTDYVEHLLNADVAKLCVIAE